MNITLNELRFLAPRFALYSAAAYLGIRMARFGIAQASTLILGSTGDKRIDNE